MAWAAVIGAGGALLGGALSSKGAKDAAKLQNEANANANKLDPRIDSMLFGSGKRTLRDGVTPTYEMTEDQFGRPRRTQTNPASDFNTDSGLLGQYRGLMDQPQSDAMKSIGDASGQYLQQNGAADMNAMRQASMGLMGGISAPQMGASQSNGTAPVNASVGSMLWNRGETVNAPSQNGIDLSGSYNSLVNGPAGANPYLTGAIQKGINQSTNAFGNMVSDAKNATSDVLGNIRGGAVIAGGYGGSRQGIAEGKAIESMNTQLGRAASQFGQNNTDAAVAAQAGAYDADRNRQLAATQGLGAQQYGVASQNASMAQQANMANQAQGNNMSQFNAGQLQNASQANAQLGQQNNQFNAGLHQQANAANLQAQLGTNQLNTNRTQTGMAGLSGLLGTAYQQAGNQDNFAINRAQQVNSLLAPYLAKNPVPQAPQVYANSAGAALGGGLMGLQFGQGLASLFQNNGASGAGAGFSGPSAGNGILSGFPAGGY